MKNISIAIRFVDGLLKNLPPDGDTRSVLLNRAGISPSLLHTRDSRVSAEQFAELANTIMLEQQDECLGYLPRPLKMGTFAMMCESAVHCKTLGQAMQKCEKFLNLFDAGAAVAVLRQGDCVALRISEAPGVARRDPYFYELALLCFQQFFGWLIGKQIAAQQVDFRHAAPSYAHEYPQMYQCLVNCDAGHNQLLFHADYLAQGVQKNELALRAILRNMPWFLLQQLNNDSSYNSRVRNIISDRIQDFPEFDWVAGRLNLGTRTLRRHLKKEGRTYQEIKNDIRRDAAIYYLLRKGFAINDVAEKIGFADTSTFIRAFKNWTGMTPHTFRRRSSGGLQV